MVAAMHPPTPPLAARLFTERAMLHAGGRSGTWGSLGCWSADTPDYASACEALTARVADAARVEPGARLLCLACGAGDELQWLLQARAAADVSAVERDAHLVLAARERTAAAAGRVQVLQGDACAPGELGLAPAAFDQVLCVDAAYHLRPREQVLQQAWNLLRPGGRLAYTDLCLEPTTARWRTPLLRTAAALCGLSAQDLLPAAAHVARLQRLGYEDVQCTDLTDAVLGGFARFVQRQGRQVAPPGWARGARRAIWTARLIGPCRAAGLGYLLLSGRKPSSAAATA